jgi:hypothetical protein
MHSTPQDEHPHLHALRGNATIGGEWMSTMSTGASRWEKKDHAARAALSVAETAEALGICEASVYRALKRGDLVGVFVNRRSSLTPDRRPMLTPLVGGVWW